MTAGTPLVDHACRFRRSRFASLMLLISLDNLKSGLPRPFAPKSHKRGRSPKRLDQRERTVESLRGPARGATGASRHDLRKHVPAHQLQCFLKLIGR
jgi:hypothetical protein